ncbi:galactokinase [Rhodothermus bifroesti]|nr:galactokinase [Rhodothermus bifroesti]
MTRSLLMETVLNQLLTAFQHFFGDTRQVMVARAPGRVNLIGDHTDYNDGFVLPMTLAQAVYMALRPRSDRNVRLYSLNFAEWATFSLDALPGKGTRWVHYIGGVVAELHRRCLLPSGFEGVVYGDVPLGSGLSSSAALEVATLVTLQNMFGFAMSGEEAARLCQHVEHTYVGVHCGIMDQFASRLGRAGHALFLDCRTLAYRHVPVQLTDWMFVIIDSQAPRALATSGYNERRAECEAGVAFFQSIDPSIRALRDVSPELLWAYPNHPSPLIWRRCRHVVEENRRVLEAVTDLEQGHLEDFGQCMNASHDSLRDLYEVSAFPLDLIVNVARSVEGVLGARLTGAGFGGCVVVLVHRDACSTLEACVRQAYEKHFGKQPAFYPLGHNITAEVLWRSASTDSDGCASAIP